jgi:hypothetical protein
MKLGARGTGEKARQAMKTVQPASERECPWKATGVVEIGRNEAGP